MRMSPRALTALAVLTSVLAGPSGRASAQYPPEAGALSGFGPQYTGGQPDFGPAPFQGGPGGPPPGMMMPPGGMMTGPAGSYEGPALSTDSLGSAGGARGPRAWYGIEYLLYWTKDAAVPFPVATIGPATGSGAIGSTGVQTLYGNTNINFNNFSGVRATAGIWITNNESLGLEGNFFILPKKYAGTPALAGSDLLSVLARPFYDTANNRQSSLIVSKPGLFLGNVTTTGGLELWGTELGPVWRARDYQNWSLDLTAAFKFLALNENLIVSDSTSTQAGGVSVLQGRAYSSPSTMTVRDQFNTYNNFFGATLGIRSNVHVQAFTWSVTGKLGLGYMDSTLRTDGTSTVVGGTNPPLTSAGGLYAAGPNLGTFNSRHFATIPEFATNLNVQITSHIGVNFGYNFMYLNNVLRPGDQITGQVNPNFVPTSPNFGAHNGPTGTTIPLSVTEFWAQGFNLALVLGW